VTGLTFGTFLNGAVAPVQVAANRFGTGTNPDADTAYVRGLYLVLLGRDADRQLTQPDGSTISEVQYWVNLLHSGMTRAQVAQGVVGSGEHRGLEVDSYYRTFLHRSERPDERAYWVAQFAAGADEVAVVEGFLNSQEYQLAHASDSSFVGALYVDVLGRFGSSSELTAAEMALNSGVTRSALADMFVRSDEAYRLALTSFYGAYLHRAPDAGSAFWLDQLHSGQTLGAVQAGILGDPGFAEFYNAGAATVK